MTIPAVIALCTSIVQSALTPAKPVDLDLKDEARDKELPVRVTFPEKKGTYPVIVFSHGLGGSRDVMQPLITPWIKSGYVVIQPQHADSGVLNRPGARRQERNQLIGNPFDRPADIKLILDNFATLESQVPGLKGKMDTKKIAMAGHSYGAWTTMAIGGLNADRIRGDRFKMDDPRPLCLLAISPQGVGQGTTIESYKPITRPTLSISGSEDTSSFDNQPAEWRKALYENQPSGDKYLLWIEGAHHNFGGISGRSFRGAGPNDAPTVDLVSQASLAFFDAYLKQSTAQKDKLKSGSFKSEETPEFTIRSK